MVAGKTGKRVCTDCGREFESAEGLDQHRHAKHTQQSSVPQQKQKSRLPKKAVATVIILLLVVGGYFVFAGKGSSSDGKPIINPDGSGFDEKAFAAKIPKGPIHWHPHVTIIIKGRQVTIPTGVGLAPVEMPVHTHEADSILHWEVQSPTVKNMQLGYFFNAVWKKKFSRECILDYCNGPDGTVNMFVNGIENTEFDHYLPHDKDVIKIVFE